MIFYTHAVVNKEPGFTYLKYELQNTRENTTFLNRFKAGQLVEIYIKPL